MARRKNEEVVDQVPDPETVATLAPSENGTPIASTIPVAEKQPVKGDRPIMKLGPYPCAGERRAFLTASIWRNEVTLEGGEVVAMYSVALTRTYYNGPDGTEAKNSGSLRAADLPLACLLLEKADMWIKSQKVS